MKYKILIVASNLNIGGTERHLLRVLPRLNRDKFDIRVYTTNEKGVLAPEFEAQGIPVYSSRTAKCIHKFGKLAKGFAYCVSFFRLQYLMLRFQPNVVHCYLQGPYLLGGVCSLLTRRPVLIMSRRITYNRNRRNTILHRFEKRLHPFVNEVTACSKTVAAELHSEGIPKEKINIIYNAIDFSQWDHVLKKTIARDQLSLSSFSLLMIVVANLHKRKGHNDLLLALSLIKDQLPKDWRLICVGRDEGQLTVLKKKSSQLGLDQHIIWTGEVPDVCPYLCAADIGILASYHEGFSNALLECMASALPMIVTDISGNNEAIIDQQSGLIVPRQSPGELASALLKLVNNPSMRLQFGKAARVRVVELFSLHQCVAAYEALYEKNGINHN